MVLLRIETKNAVCNLFAIIERNDVDFETDAQKKRDQIIEKTYTLSWRRYPHVLRPLQLWLHANLDYLVRETDNPDFNKIM